MKLRNCVCPYDPSEVIVGYALSLPFILSLSKDLFYMLTETPRPNRLASLLPSSFDSSL